MRDTLVSEGLTQTREGSVGRGNDVSDLEVARGQLEGLIRRFGFDGEVADFIGTQQRLVLSPLEFCRESPCVDR